MSITKFVVLVYLEVVLHVLDVFLYKDAFLPFPRKQIPQLFTRGAGKSKGV